MERDEQTDLDRDDAPGVTADAEPGTTLVPVRRRPDMVRFIATGAVIGAILGGIVAYLGPDAPNSSLLQELIIVSLLGALILGFLGAVVYLVADRSGRGA